MQMTSVHTFLLSFQSTNWLTKCWTTLNYDKNKIWMKAQYNIQIKGINFSLILDKDEIVQENEHPKPSMPRYKTKEYV